VRSGIFSAQCLNYTGNLFFLRFRVLLARREFGMDPVKKLPQCLSRLLWVEDRNRPEQNALFDGFDFEIVALFQVKLFAQLCRKRNLRRSLESHKRHLGLILFMKHMSYIVQKYEILNFILGSIGHLVKRYSA
jgi:hypothetical protein